MWAAIALASGVPVTEARKQLLCDEQNDAHIEKDYIFKSTLFLFQLVDLKAELYRKQEQFKHDKLGQENGGASLTSKSKVKVNMSILTLSIMSLTNIYYYLDNTFRNRMSGANRMLAFQQELRRIQSCWRRKRSI